MPTVNNDNITGNKRIGSINTGEDCNGTGVSKHERITDSLSEVGYGDAHDDGNRHIHLHHTKETPQTQVLGRDGSDYNLQRGNAMGSSPFPGDGSYDSLNERDVRRIGGAAKGSETTTEVCVELDTINGKRKARLRPKISRCVAENVDSSVSGSNEGEAATIWKQVTTRLWPIRSQSDSKVSSPLVLLEAQSSGATLHDSRERRSGDRICNSTNGTSSTNDTCTNARDLFQDESDTCRRHNSKFVAMSLSSPLHFSNSDPESRSKAETGAALETSVGTDSETEDDIEGNKSPYLKTKEQQAIDTSAQKSAQEDQVRKDCSFFYRPIDDDDNQQYQQQLYAPAVSGIDTTSPVFTPTTNLSRDLKRSGRIRYSYWRRKNNNFFQTGDVDDYYYDYDNDILGQPYLADYKARYEQLNQDLHPTKSAATRKIRNFPNKNNADVLLEYHDLELQEQQIRDTNTTSQNIHLPTTTGTSSSSCIPTTTFTRSTLLYKNDNDGRTLVRLPRDRVRLVMDPSLEPGILSAYYSYDSYPQYVTNSDADALENPPTKQLNQNSYSKNPNANLMYCLTVPPTLYQQVLSEVSDRFMEQTSFCCTIKRIFKEGNDESYGGDDDRVDIRVAWCILFIVFLVLLVNTIIWPVN